MIGYLEGGGLLMNPRVNNILPESELFYATPSNLACKIFFYVTCAGHFYYEEGYRLLRNQYHSYLIMYIINGSAKVMCNDKEYIAKKGDVVFMNCYNAHGYEACKKLETLWFHFDSVQAAEYFNEINQLHECVITLKDPYPVVNGMNKIVQMHRLGKNINEAMQSAYISRILASFFAPSGQYSDNRKHLVEDTIAYIGDHLSEELCIKELAKNVSISEFHFSRVFKKETSYTVREYITKTRVTHAKVLLKSTRLSLKEIAYRCGFSNESSFSNAFKRNTDMTPGKFRSTWL